MLELLGASAVFMVLYAGIASALAGGLSKAEAWLFTTASDLGGWWTGAGIVLFLLLIPAAAAWIINARYRKVLVSRRGKDKTVRKLATRNRPIPRAWDVMAYGAVTSRFVRIKTESGEYYGGWFGGTSYISTYPHERDIFIEAQWKMGVDGAFVEPIEDSLGLWVPLTDRCVVDWLLEPSDDRAHSGPKER